MIKFKDFTIKYLSEELTPEQKQEVDLWDHTKGGRAKKISGHISGFNEEGRHVIPVEHDSTPIAPHPDVESHLKSKGYEVHDYRKGLATKSGDKRVFKIGGLIADNPDVKKKFDNDPNRKTIKNPHENLRVTISRHPYDVAGMSTDRGWRSCMTMAGCGDIGGSNKHYLPYDIKEGTHVAYLHYKDDTDLKHPIARIALKPYHAEDSTKSSKHVILRSEPTVYGSGNTAFEKTVHNWSEKHFPAKDDTVYIKNENVYDDGSSDVVIGKPTNDKLLKHNNHTVRLMLARNADLKADQIHTLLNDSDPQVREFVATRHDLNKDHYDKLTKDNDYDVRKTVSFIKKLDSSHISNLINHSDDGSDIRGIFKNENFNDGHVDQILSRNKIGLTREMVIGKKDLKKDHITSILKNHSTNVNIQNNVMRTQKNLDADHIHMLLNSKEPHLREMIAQRSDLTKEHVDRLLSDPEHSVKTSVLNNYNVPITDNHIDKIVNSDDVVMKSYLVNRSRFKKDEKSNPINLKPHHIDKLVNDNNSSTRSLMTSYPNLRREHIDKLVNDDDFQVKQRIASRRDLSPEHIEKLSNDSNELVLHALIKNPKTPDQILQKLTKHDRVGHYAKDELISRKRIGETK